MGPGVGISDQFPGVADGVPTGSQAALGEALGRRRRFPFEIFPLVRPCSTYPEAESGVSGAPNVHEIHHLRGNAWGMAGSPPCGPDIGW